MRRLVYDRRKTRLKALIASGLCLAMLGASVPSGKTYRAAASTESNKPIATTRENTYDAYLAAVEDKSFSSAEVLIQAADYTGTDMDIEIYHNLDGDTGESVLTADEGYIEWKVSVPEEGLYNIGIRYYPIKGKNSAIERELSIDGVVPFSGADSLTLSRVWTNAEPIKQDSRGNDIRPSQVEHPMWLDAVLRDKMGYYNEPYRFYFSKGTHTIRLTSIKEPMVIKSLKLFRADEVPEYEQVKKQYESMGYTEASDFLRKIQGEDAVYKSDPMIYPIFDRSSPATEPYHHSKLKLNTIGAERWQLPDQWVIWEFEVPEDGLYKIAIKGRQNIMEGIYTNRRLLIDGKVPFKEAGSIRFPYKDEWVMKTIGDEETGEPYLFYLEAGKHQLMLENTLGDMADILRVVEDSVYQLNQAYRKILMITGSAPDVYRDYQLHKRIPQVIETLAKQSEVLSGLSQRMLDYMGERGSHVALLDRMAFQLKGMAEEPETIARRFDAFKGNVGALGTWILDTRHQPLEVDYICIAAPDTELPRAKAGFFQQLIHEIRAFFASFSEDYSTIGDIHDDKEAVTVWIGSGVTGGRDQAQILKQMVDNYFTANTGIPINLQLISMGALLPATLAGKGPDVALQMGGSEPVNYAVRNAVVDLTQFPDFNETAQRFHESALLPFRFLDGVYALPETQSYPMLFYRKDIFEELGIEVPQTWEDVYEIIPVIQKKNMNFGMPIGMPGFAMLLFQNDGEFYYKDGVASALDTETSILTFRDWTELYVNYKLPLEYDFANRFRIGELPAGIADYTTYNLLTVFAPEIRGLWEFAPVPGTLKPDGTIDRSVPGTTAGCIMMSDVKDKEAAWEFMKWWTQTDTQVRFGQEMESIMGAAARHSTANMEALYQIPWPTRDFNNLMAQWEWVKGIPEVPGGYFTSRHLDFAFRNVVYDGTDPRETLLDYVMVIDEEIRIKRSEFGLNLE